MTVFEIGYPRRCSIVVRPEIYAVVAGNASVFPIPDGFTGTRLARRKRILEEFEFSRINIPIDSLSL